VQEVENLLFVADLNRFSVFDTIDIVLKKGK
jgi:hypothetical protein